MANAELEQINKDIQKAYEANNFKKGNLHKKAKQINPSLPHTSGNSLHRILPLN